VGQEDFLAYEGGSSLLNFENMSPEDELLKEEAQSRLSGTTTPATSVSFTMNGWLTKHLTDSHWFNCAACSVICINTLAIALQVALIQDHAYDRMFEYIDVLFTTVYAIEVGWRLQEKRMSFFTSSGWLWNVFDLVVTGMSVIDSSLVLMKVHNSSNGESACRLFRILRIIRMFRMVRFLGDLEFVVLMAVRATIKLFILVSLVIFVSAVVATHLLHDSSNNNVVSEYGNLGRSMWTLLKMMTLGNSGSMNVASSENPGGIGVTLFFVVYIFCACIAVISLVPAIFIALNLEARAKDQRAARDREERHEERFLINAVEHIYDLARSLSRCCEQGVSWTEIDVALGSPEMLTLFDKHPPEKLVETRICLSAIYEEAQAKISSQTPVRMLRHELVRGYEVSSRTLQVRMWHMIAQQQRLMQRLLEPDTGNKEPAIMPRRDSRRRTTSFVRNTGNVPQMESGFQTQIPSSTPVHTSVTCGISQFSCADDKPLHSSVLQGSPCESAGQPTTNCPSSLQPSERVSEVSSTRGIYRQGSAVWTSVDSPLDGRTPQMVNFQPPKQQVINRASSLLASQQVNDLSNNRSIHKQESACGTEAVCQDPRFRGLDLMSKRGSPYRSHQLAAEADEFCKSHFHSDFAEGGELCPTLQTQTEDVSAVKDSVKAAVATASAVAANRDMLLAQQPIEEAVNSLVLALLDFTTAAHQGGRMITGSMGLHHTDKQLSSVPSPLQSLHFDQHENNQRIIYGTELQTQAETSREVEDVSSHHLTDQRPESTAR